MAHCEKFLALSPIEQSEMIGKVAHCLMNSNILFESAEIMIENGEDFGLFDNVKFGHNAITKNENY